MEKERINVAEILRNCQSGMELDCTMYNKVTLLNVDDGKNRIFPIKVLREDEKIMTLTKYGQYTDEDFAKCVIFPKGQTWEDFVPPCVFNDGDVVFTTIGNFAIISNKTSEGIYSAHCIAFDWGNFTTDKISVQPKRLATEEEKAILFDTIKANGYRWNEETKTLEKLIAPKFKVGDVIINQDFDTATITEVDLDNERYGYELFLAKGIGSISFSEESNWELVPDKFNITTLIPFESRVLVRNSKAGIWKPAIWGFYSGGVLECYSVLGGISWSYCIPYEGNEHLLGTTNDCDDFYKTWSK